MFHHSHPDTWSFHRRTCLPEAALRAPWLAPPIDNALPPPKAYHGVPVVELPPPELPVTPLAEVLRRRASCRRFDGSALETAEIATLLAAGYGVFGATDVEGFSLTERPVPSAGARHPLEVYLLARAVRGLGAGVFHYAAHRHRLEQLRGPIPWRAVGELFLGQPWLEPSSAVAVLSAVAHRTLLRYGDRGYRYLLMEAGHAAQNLNLAACALGIGSLDLGGFHDAHLADLLGLDPHTEIPLYAVALGRPSTDDRARMRIPPAAAVADT